MQYKETVWYGKAVRECTQGRTNLEGAQFRTPDSREGWSLSGVIRQGINYFLGVQVVIWVCSGSSGASGTVDFWEHLGCMESVVFVLWELRNGYCLAEAVISRETEFWTRGWLFPVSPHPLCLLVVCIGHGRKASPSCRIPIAPSSEKA